MTERMRTLIDTLAILNKAKMDTCYPVNVFAAWAIVNRAIGHVNAEIAELVSDNG